MFLDPADEDIAELGIAQHLGPLQNGKGDRDMRRRQSGVKCFVALEDDGEGERAYRLPGRAQGG
jgi:hypothetical protein